MKRFFSFSVLTLIVSMLLSSANAAHLTLYGTADKDAQGVTILVLDKGTDRSKISSDDIRYIDQSDINADGSFVLNLPFFEKEDYDFYSNMSFELVDDTEDKTGIIYVSSSGNDANNGESEDAPLASLSAAYKKIYKAGKIILLDSTTYVEAPVHTGNLTIEGAAADVVLTLPSEVSLAGNLTINNVTLSTAATIYANGYSLVIESSVTSTSRLTVYGGKKSANLAGDTDIKLLGGLYTAIYGGCNGGTVTGNTNVVLGGEANKGDGINDKDTSTISPCYVYGGGNNGAVTGKTNITLKDNAVTKYLVGAGKGTNGTATDTNIYINGGKVMNVYAGSTNVALPDGVCTHITMTGGLAEALFGGCESVSMTGHTHLTLLGGNVSRRVYTGCYNEWKLSWKSSNHVIGTTTLVLGPSMELSTGTELDNENATNKGVFSGSRMSSQNDAEQNTIIYLDNSYESLNSKIGDISGWSLIFKSFEDYTVQAGTNGTVYGTTTPGTIYIAPKKGYEGVIKSAIYENTNATIGTGTTAVEFREKDFFINSVSPEKVIGGIDGTADIFANNRGNQTQPRMIVAVYEADTNNMVSCSTQNVNASNPTEPFSINCTLETNKTYIIKAMLWNAEETPLTKSYTVTLR